VNHATVRVGRTATSTNASGAAQVRVAGRRRITVTAGDTLRPATVTVG
jgi:hypothetical protein